MFKEITNRDAWSTIRGFVYQVDLTILRWLSLKENQILELEKGEDIDVINRDFQNKELSRELGQIKYRESNISLNQELTIEILFNFFVHKQNNSAQRILFRFITNAKYTIERPALFIDGKAGIEVWIELFKSDTIGLDDERLKIIKNHLKIKIEEKIISDPTKIKEDQKEDQKNWNDFNNFIDDSNIFLQFIKDFEWSVNNDDSINISDTIKAEIVKSIDINDLNTAEIIYPRLFLFVFKLLTNKGLKQLDSSELQIQLSLPELNAGDIELLQFIKETFCQFEERVNILEEKTIINTEQISKLVDDVNLIQNSDTVFDYRLKNISTSRPILSKFGSQRDKKVDVIIKYFDEYKWIGFQGINGTGKSQLASLIADKFQNIFWLDLRAYNDSVEKTTLLIETLLSTISNHPIENDRENWITKVFDSFNSDTIIVFNDVPKFEINSSLYDLFILFSEKISKSKVRLLTTSNYKFSNSLLQSFDDNVLFQYDDFEFSDKEIIEIIINSGGDESIAKYIGLITIISHRNPRILSSIIYHLRSINWGKNSDLLFDVILKNEFSNEILQDAQFSIKKYISDEKSRELLYRLSLTNWNLELKEITAICQVEEKIQYPNEKLQDLINVWIEQQDKSYLVSPLIYNIGEQNLSQNTIKATHIAIAKSILEDKNINQINASRIISSFIKGKDFNNAGIILVMVYQSANSIESVKQLKDWGYLSYWSAIDIPEEMSVILRAQIRNEQIRLYKLINKDSLFLLEKLRNYVNENNLKISEKVLVTFLIINNIDPNDVTNYWNYLSIILHNFSSIDEPFKEIITCELLSGLLWIPLNNLTNIEDIKQWLKLIEKLEGDFQIDFFENEISQSAVTILCGKIVNSENLKPIEDRNVALIINNLNYLIEYFTNRNNEILISTVIREKIAIEFQILKKYAEAEKLSIELTEKFESKIAKYLIYDKLGRLLYNHKKIQESTNWLLKAIEIDCTEQINFIDTLIYTACSYSISNPEKSVEYLKRARDLFKVIPAYEYNELIYIQILGELGISYWLNSEFENSFITFEEVISRLLDIKEKYFNNEWIRIFSWSGHVLGYISAEVSKDRVPTHFNDGGEYIKPYQGIYVFNTKDLSDLYINTKDAIVTAHMAVFADGVNSVYKAYSWSLKAFDIARRFGDEQTFLMISAVCGQYSTVNFKIEEALETSLLFSAVTSHLSGTPTERQNELKKIKLEDLLSQKPSEKWNIAEVTTITITIIPLFITVITKFLKNEENKYETFHAFRNLISNYIKEASDKQIWNDLLDLTDSIIEGKTSKSELIQKSNQYGDNDNKNFQIISILGYVFYSENEEDSIIQVVNAFPYLTKTYKQANSIIKFILVPFVRLIAKEILKKSFIGTKVELNSILDKIDSINNSDQNPIQKILQPVVNELDIELLDDRKLWLYDYKEI
ncbi:V-type ATP synthase subunit I domain-containing protein [Flavobacterium psychrophilum]|uniref:hypothetical protein n=2 Tax=Flavobacterium psychrophilum TaxID=96345 RepID=UPI000B7C0C97|nr:hypothetical protein [Flavobacterium psychrophilum]MCB5994335.1 hypothetical protein [Flavobacterium psychrophilum]MCB5996458.1 hypothetical protein [Flavobacterium psychrophilum]MCB6004061.1 hypothetical protein [Flavobacterium psychrophilum]MCB6006526.1 hypothetical protein [Flavobacterium psychrophilum]MCB6018638.1 hypothetical protein [Flavobacterium psychrophilum]